MKIYKLTMVDGCSAFFSACSSTFFLEKQHCVTVFFLSQNVPERRSGSFLSRKSTGCMFQCSGYFRCESFFFYFLGQLRFNCLLYTSPGSPCQMTVEFFFFVSLFFFKTFINFFSLPICKFLLTNWKFEICLKNWQSVIDLHYLIGSD